MSMSKNSNTRKTSENPKPKEKIFFDLEIVKLNTAMKYSEITTSCLFLSLTTMSSTTSSSTPSSPQANDAIPDSLPPLSGGDKTITLTAAEFSTALRLLMDYENLLKGTIKEIRHQMDEHLKTHNSLRMPPPELDNFCTDQTLAKRLIQELNKKSPF
jgi:hypothetical protein